jgi:hypothetical protein
MYTIIYYRYTIQRILDRQTYKHWEAQKQCLLCFIALQFEFIIVLNGSFSQLMPKVNAAKSGQFLCLQQEIHHKEEVILGQKRSIP